MIASISLAQLGRESNGRIVGPEAGLVYKIIHLRYCSTFDQPSHVDKEP